LVVVDNGVGGGGWVVAGDGVSQFVLLVVSG
jgi:hypothetical protein